MRIAMFSRRRIAVVNLCERFRRSFSSKSMLSGCRNLAKQYKEEVMNQNKDTLPPLLVNYGDGFLQMLTFSTLHTRDDFVGRRQPVSVQFPRDFIVCGPCHGLFCVYSVKGEFSLWNPATGDMKNLPAGLPPSDEEEIKVQNVGFGFDSTINDYKVVRYITRRRFCNNNFEDDKITHQIQICSLKSKQWRGIHVPREILSSLPLLSPGSYADGACYWTSKTQLISFVFAEEEFHMESLLSSIPVPSKDISSCLMGTFNGFPAAICHALYTSKMRTPYGKDTAQEFQIWVRMREYGVPTWGYLKETGIFYHPTIYYTPLCLWTSRGLIMFDPTYRLVWYDFETYNVITTNLSLLGSFQRLEQNREEAVSIIQVLNFPETLISNPW